MSLKLNVINREGKQTTIDIEEDMTIRDAIDDVLSPDNYGVAVEIVTAVHAIFIFSPVTLKN